MIFLQFTLIFFLLFCSQSLALFEAKIPPQDIQFSLMSLKKLDSKNPTEDKILHLQAILYIDESHWTVWINGHSFASDKSREGAFNFIHVYQDYVKLTWSHKGKSHLIQIKLNEAVKWSQINQ